MSLVLLEATTRWLFFSSGKNIEVHRNFSFTRSAHNTEEHPELGYRLLPNVARNAFTSEFELTYTTNSLGLRDREVVENDDFRILVLGDSQTFGEGVDATERFTDLTEKKLDAVRVINAGVPGYGIHQMRLWLERFGLDLHPNLVVCALIRVDLDRVIYKRRPEPSHVDAVKAPPPLLRMVRETVGAIARQSFFYSFARVQWKIAAMRRTLRRRDQEVWAAIEAAGLHGGFKNTTEGQRVYIEEELAAELRALSSLVRSRGVPLLVVNIDDQPLPRLEQMVRRLDIDYLDMSDTLRGTPELRFEIDRHYTRHGHRAIAAELAAFLETHYVDGR